MRGMTGYAGALFVVTVAFTLFEQIDVLLIGAIISTTAVAIFEAPLRLTTFLAYGGMALAMGVGPRLARSAGEGPNVEAFATGTRYLLLLQGAIACAPGGVGRAARRPRARSGVRGVGRGDARADAIRLPVGDRHLHNGGGQLPGRGAQARAPSRSRRWS